MRDFPLTPHPDVEQMTLNEIEEERVTVEQDFEFGKANGAEHLFLVHCEQRRNLLLTELKRRTGNGVDVEIGNVENGLNSHNSLFSQPLPEQTTLAPEGLHGLAGDAVKIIQPYSEADPVALLVNSLVAFGNVIGRKPHFTVEHSKHHLNLFAALVGQSSKGRKGQSWSTPSYMFKQIDEDWVKQRVTGGLSSGEGVVYAVRDATTKTEPIKDKGRVVDYQEVITDSGVDDKRLLLLEEELSQALKVMAREGNILSPILRQAWDSGNLHPLTKNNPIVATDAHISIIGHITKDELLRHLNETEKANGFANRFIWLLVGRSKAIPNPTGVPAGQLEPIVGRLRETVEFARGVERMTRDGDAELLWAEVYPELSEGKPGMTGAIIGRAEAQAMRLACLYALLDLSELVNVEHLNAALALWDYAERSVELIFGELRGDPHVDKAYQVLRTKGSLSRTALSTLFGRHVPPTELDRIENELIRLGATPEDGNDGVGRRSRILRAAK